MTLSSSSPVSVFVSYAVHDQKRGNWLKRLKVHLKPLERQYHFAVWDDGNIELGKKWRHEISEAIAKATAAVFLVGPHFLASDFIEQFELRPLLDRAQHDEIPLLILLTDPCNFEVSPLANLQAYRERYTPLKPLSELKRPQQEDVLKNFGLAIRDVIERTVGVPGTRGVQPSSFFVDRPKPIRHNLSIMPTEVVGRDREQDDLLKFLKQSIRPVVIASGFGGVGKSTVARMVAWKCVEHQTPFKFIAWVDLRHYGRINEGRAVTFQYVLDSIAKAADPSSEIAAIGDIEVKTARVGELLSTTDSLLILDNYEHLMEEPAEEEKVARFISSLPIGRPDGRDRPIIRVLMTTRIVPRRRSGIPTYSVRLERLPFQDSLKMMKLQSGGRKLSQQQWRRVWKILHGLPKYMQTAVGQLQMMTFDDWERMSTDIKWESSRPDDYFHSLFDCSWRNPAIISEQLKRILLAMTFFVGHAPPEELRKTSGLRPGEFQSALLPPYDALYVEVVRERSGTECYSMHPLVYAFCKLASDSPEFQLFQEGARKRFVDVYLEFIKKSSNRHVAGLMDQEMPNILAATRIAVRMRSWEKLIEFRRYVAGFLRSRGYWVEYRRLVEHTLKACQVLGEEELQGECLVYDLAWCYLRLEDVPTARKLVNRGLRLFKKHDHLNGIAQALRHLGKVALLEGLDEQYRPTPLAKKYFAEAERYYVESLLVRERLQKQGHDQRLLIGDMNLDFGRLYWLQGVDLEEAGRRRQDNGLLTQAWQKYESAVDVTEEARRIFEEAAPDLGVRKARISKVYGNLGNAAKEMCAYLAKNCEMGSAVKLAATAEDYYYQNLVLGQEIGKKDEIAHALAGLAENRLQVSLWPVSPSQVDERKAILERALKDAKRAHRMYEELAILTIETEGKPEVSRVKTRDEIRMQVLVLAIERLLSNRAD